jgi:hypothetical protein
MSQFVAQYFPFLIAGAIATGVGLYFVLRGKSSTPASPLKSVIKPVAPAAPQALAAPAQASVAPAPHEVAHGAVTAAASAVQVCASITASHPTHVQEAGIALASAAKKVLENVIPAVDMARSKLPASKPAVDEAARQSAMNEANDALKKATDALQRAKG